MGLVKRMMEEQQEYEDSKALHQYLAALVDAGQIQDNVTVGKMLTMFRPKPADDVLYTDCTRCACPIPPHELVGSVANEGMCAYCWHMDGKD